jgi:predicted phosphodiesterase
LRIDFINERFIMLVSLVHSRALLNLQDRVKKEHEDCNGIILGHTHLPMHQVSPDLPFLLNDGDMRHSSTFTIEDDVDFHRMTWNLEQKQWKIVKIPRP